MMKNQGGSHKWEGMWLAEEAHSGYMETWPWAEK